MLGIYLRITHPANPILPGDVPTMNQYRLVMGVIPDVFEEQATAEERDLQCLDVDVGVEGVPGVCSDAVGDKRRKQSIKVKKKKDCAELGVRRLASGSPKIGTHRMPHISSSTRNTL